jgi:hypothetical protein
MTRHELYAHPKPVITCPVCILIHAQRILNEKHRR